MAVSDSKNTHPGWEEALRELVEADKVFLNECDLDNPDQVSSALASFQSAIYKLHKILGTVAHPLVVPDDIGGHIMSLTEGWENFWLDHDMLSAIHSPAPISDTNKVVVIDVDNQFVIEDVTINNPVGSSNSPVNLDPITHARRRLFRANNIEAARLVLVCARITCVDILLRQPKRSSIFLNSYFQTFPSFICQVASVGNLMANRAMTRVPATSESLTIEMLIAIASMSLISTVITETNHVTQGLSVLSANNPHSGILANLLNTCLSPHCLSNGLETFMVSKAAIFLLSSSIQTARHPGSVANSTFIRKILETLVNPQSHPGVTHASCVCLEVAIESSMNGFSLLFRDLEAFDKLIDRARFLIAQKSPLDEQTQKAVSSIFALLRLSFQSQEIHIGGINLHEKLSIPNSPLTSLFKSIISAGSSVMGKNAFNGCLTLLGNVMADDPLIISTIVDCGIADSLIDCCSAQLERHPEILSSIFVAICALHLHESGATKVKAKGDCLSQMLNALAADQWYTSLESTDGKTNVMGYVMNEDNRIIEDIGMVVGQSCDDINRNISGWGQTIVGKIVSGLSTLVSDKSADSIGIRTIPALRMLYGGVLTNSDCVDEFVKLDGIEVLIRILRHPKLEPGIILRQVPNTNRNHPLMAVFKLIGQRGGKDKQYQWQKPLAKLMEDLVMNKEPMNEDLFCRITSICSLATVASSTPSMSGTTGDTSGGSLVLLVSRLCSIVPQLLDFYTENKTESSCAGWLALKNFLLNIAKNANSIVLSPRAIVGKGEVGPTGFILSRVLACTMSRILNAATSASAEKMTEIIDLLVRLTIEDKSHSVRPLVVLELYKSGGIHNACDLVKTMVTSATPPSAFESLLVFFERVTSHKRFTNASITNAVFPEPNGRSEMKNLVTSMCANVGETCQKLMDNILSISTLSATCATAIMKILSHAVTMVEIDDGNDRSAKRSASPVRKRARAATAASPSSGTTEVNISDLNTLYASTFDEKISGLFQDTLIQLVNPELPDKTTPYVGYREVSKISRSIASEFVVRCILLGDKGNCEMQAAELMSRHADAFGSISIRPARTSRAKDNASYLSDVATEYGFERKSRTASAILGSRITSESLKSMPVADLGKSVGQMLEAILSLTEGEELLIAAVTDETDWLGPLIAMVHPSVIAGVFGGLGIETQQKFLARLFDILKHVGNAKVGSRSSQAIVHACLPVIASLLVRRENMTIGFSRISVLMNLPSKCRTHATAPLITEIFMKLANSDLWVAVRLSKELDAFTLGGERSLSDFTSNESFVSAMVTDSDVMQKLCLQILKRKGEDKIVRADEQDDESSSSGDKDYDFSVFDGSMDKIGLILDHLVDYLIEASARVNKLNCAGLGDMIESSESEYPYAITVESCLIMITAVLSEVATIREVDERYIEVQTRILNRLVSEVGRALISNLADIEEDTKHETKIGTNEKIFKLIKVWMDTINRCSPWMSADVLGMIADELEKDNQETNVLRTYAYSGLTFMLCEGSELSLPIIERLIPLISIRLRNACKSESHLCRHDTQLEFQALYASLYLLIQSIKPANDAARADAEDGTSEDNDASDEGSSDDSSNDMEIVDHEMDEDGEDGSDHDEDDDDEDVDDEEDDDESSADIVFVDDHDEDDMIGGGSMDDGSMEDSEGALNEGGEARGAGGGGSLSSYDDEDSDDDEDQEGEDGYEDWDEEDMWGDENGYDEAEWEEDSDEDVVGEAVYEDEEEIGHEVAEIIEGNGGFASGLSSAVPIGSPVSGPVSAPPVMAADQSSLPPSFMVPNGGLEFPKSVVEAARKTLEEFGKNELDESFTDEVAEDLVVEQEEEVGQEESSSPDLSQLSDEAAQFAGLNNLSAEERLSIQQALAATGEDFDFDMDNEDDMDSDDEMDEEYMPRNISELHLENMNNREVVIEVPSGLDRNAQANMISAAINSLDNMFTTGETGTGIRRERAGGHSRSHRISEEFKIEDELPKPEVSDKYCSDSPQFKLVNKWSDDIVTCLSDNIGSVSSRALMLRNQLPFKAGLDRVLIQLCFDPKSRNIVLSTLFDSLLNFIYPSRTKCTWSFAAPFSDPTLLAPPKNGVYDSSLHPLIDNALRHLDSNNPSQSRSVGSGRMINTITMILNHVPRARSWFGLPNMFESRTEIVATNLAGFHSMFELHSAGRRTPEKSSLLRKRQAVTPPHAAGYVSSDGEGPLTRAVSTQVATSGSLPPRKTTPITVAIKLLTSNFLQSSPSHSLILVNMIAQAVDAFPASVPDKTEQERLIRHAVTEEAVQLLCDFLVENRNRLRHMPEFDRAVARAGQVLVSLCSDIRTREIVRARLIATGSRLVAEIMDRLNQLESFTAVPLVRLFKTAKDAFGTKRIAASERETFLDFSSAITNIDSLWEAVDVRLSGHNNLLVGLPSIAQQALAKRRGEGDSSNNAPSPVSEADVENPGNRIAALETISKLIPLVELFLSAHDITGIIGDPSKTHSEGESKITKSVMDFIERHRRPINSMVKSRPSILNRAFAPLVAICPHMLDFDNKRQFFRAKLRHQDGDKRQPPPPQMKLVVRRDDVFRDSYAKLQVRTKDEWRGKLNITFQGEEGVDAGGLVREWFTLLAREIFNPNYALFTPASGRPSTFLINPASSVNPDHIHYFRFCGRFIGKAVYDNQRIDAYFVRSFYKYMLGKEVTWRDMETTDPDYFKNLNWILENDMTDVDYYSFTVEENEFGKLKVVELVPGGEDKRVTEENKQEYVRLVCEHKLTRGIQEQLKAFLQGFHELIPEQIVGSLFDDKELEMLISGLPTIDIEDLKRNTDYVQYTAESEQIKWFWEALEKFSEDELAWFLQFVTGSTQVPLEGFKGLAGMHGPQRFSIHRIRVEDRLPTAHTCFNQLDLPEYASYEILASKLKQAVREGHSGFGFI